MRKCQWCKGPIRRAARRDAKTCSKKCRQAKHRFRVGVAPHSRETRPMRFAYADPPYPGTANCYPENQEVNHRILIGTLLEHYPDGWALSTSSKTLHAVLELCPRGVEVASWVKGPNHVRNVQNRPRDAWEPLIVYGGRTRRLEGSEQIDNVLVWGGRQHSHPGAIIGMKPAAFCEWMFRQLGAMAHDTLDDLFPGSGSVGRAWGLYTSRLPGGDVSAGTKATSRLAEASTRLAEVLTEADSPMPQLTGEERLQRINKKWPETLEALAK